MSGHHGVATIISDPKRQFFLLEQKDDCYTSPYMNCWAPFGGEVGPDEQERKALAREIGEEIDEWVWKEIRGSTKLFKRTFLQSNGDPYHIAVYESTLSVPLMNNAKRIVNSRERADYRIRASVMRREFLPDLLYAHSLETIIGEYLTR